MGLFAHARPIAAAFALATALTGLTACESGGDGTALPSKLPSIERSADRETTEATKSPEPTETTRSARPTRTTDAPATSPATTPTKTEPTKTEPTKTAEPTKTQPTTTEATTETTTKTTTEAAAPTATTPAPTPSEAAATTTTSGISTLGWFLIILLIGLAILVAVLLVNRSRRSAAWETEAVDLAAAGRNLIATRLPTVLSTRESADRALAWPPVRADLTEMAARWGQLSGRATDDYHRDSAGQVSVMTQDLVTAIDAENQALATGRDWRMLSPQVDEIVRTLDTALTAFVVPQPDPNATTGGGPDPYPA
ncbi:hypothetical protein [Paractinoplanes globisporus]|uniref:Uncharacterized protein n=1 Tax=Paractinoplanes globisporus TaxID=113565 RepID=A0ABW6WRK7_9ACTN|nr:hypothetical protein [Actinoplanes globisporus]